MHDLQEQLSTSQEIILSKVQELSTVSLARDDLESKLQAITQRNETLAPSAVNCYEWQYENAGSWYSFGADSIEEVLKGIHKVPVGTAVQHTRDQIWW